MLLISNLDRLRTEEYAEGFREGFIESFFKSRRETRCVFALMETAGVSMKEAMDLLKVESDRRERILEVWEDF